MLFSRLGLILALSAATMAAQASNLDVNLGGNSAYIDYAASLTNTGLQGDVGYLHHTDRLDMGDVGVQLVGNGSPSGSPVYFGVGGKFFYIHSKQASENGEAAALGGYFSAPWPTYNRFVIGGEVYYAPNIVSFGHADRFLTTRLSVGYQILRNADVYVGYRYTSAAFSGSPTLNLDSSIIAGISLTF